MELNFVFLRVGAVRWYRPRAKNEKRQNRLGLDVQAGFTIPPSAINRTHLPLHKGGSNRFILFGVVQTIYRQSYFAMISLISNCLPEVILRFDD